MSRRTGPQTGFYDRRWAHSGQLQSARSIENVAALECDLKRVLSDEADVLDTELFGSKVLDTREAPWGTCLTATFGAGAGPAELLARIGAVVSVLPIHGHHLAFAVHVDVDWKRVGVLQLVSRPLPDVDHRQLPE
jgi:hypothetical protein